ncbi:molecular chaperone [Orbus sturtevantii]|uniref:fimbrial biogenesis chaperone n=1 Tax=Orbus sturtevantii TaxID=3074109 RepID=UPI00370D4301
MKITILFFSLFFSLCSFANNIIVNGTRFIYPGNEKEITVQMTNTADRPAIAQAWLDNGDPNESPDTIKTPFQITPPISRIEAKGGQVLRIKLMNKQAIPTDRESLWWLNILDIPALSKKEGKDENVLQLAIRSRFKFIYRPTGLGTPESAVEKLSLIPKGNQLSIDNKSPFYVTVTKISTDNKGALNDKTLMIAPYSVETLTLSKALKSGEVVTINYLNDYGADVANTVKVK